MAESNCGITTVSKSSPQKEKPNWISIIFDIADSIAAVTVLVMLLFAFIVQLNIVDGQSMEQTLYHQDQVVTWRLFYEPAPGDIVLIHDISAAPYDRTIVKRVIATGGQTVDIDFDTWTLTVDGEVIEENYRFLDASPTLTADYEFPITLQDHEVFVLGDNRNNSADSRQSEIGPIDKRCIIGKVVARWLPLDRITVFH